MATVISVHGTYAHYEGKPEDKVGNDYEKQWWEPGSTFESELKERVTSEDGAIAFEAFVWDGENSEVSRRAAGHRLFKQAHELEAAGENYALVGHSHGGSVISSALLESIAKRKSLKNLSRWLSVGTPFVNLRKELFLFSRIPLILQAIYVALLLFVVMFFLPMLLGVFASEEVRSRYMGGFSVSDLGSFDGLATLGLTTLIVSSVFILFLIFLYFMDRRILHMHATRNINKARAEFSPRWLSLTHEDDEVVQGLRSLGSVNFSIFHKDFFVPVFTALAVFALPFAYLVLICSPAAMTGLTSYLKDNVYRYDATTAIIQEASELRDEVRSLRKSMRGSGLTMRGCFNDEVQNKPSANMTAAQAEAICERWREARKKYREIRKEQPNLPRVLRFQASYLDPDTGELQGKGSDLRVNSWLLFNLLNDGVVYTLGLDQVDVTPGDDRLTRSDRQIRRVLRLLIPALLVPLAFALSAVIVLFLVRRISRFFSGYIAYVLDRLTWRQVRRTALGNDTSSEVAFNADDRPHWLEQRYNYLPKDLAEKLSQHSNNVALKSIGKFRNAISDLAFADAKDTSSNVVTEYFTWKELVHSAYFDVPEFRKLVAYAIAQSDGFKPTDAFKADPDYAKVAGWFQELQLRDDAPEPVETETPASQDDAPSRPVGPTVASA